MKRMLKAIALHAEIKCSAAGVRVPYASARCRIIATAEATEVKVESFRGAVQLSGFLSSYAALG